MSIPKGRDRKLLLQWYKIRDLWFGENHVGQDKAEALRLARTCEHPEAQFLCGKGEPIKGYAIFFYCNTYDTDADKCEFLVRQAAEQGHAKAQAMFFTFVKNDTEKFDWAVRSAAQGERDGFCRLAWCYSKGVGCEKNETTFLELVHSAAKLGDLDSMFIIGLQMYNVNACFGMYMQGKALCLGFSNQNVGAVVKHGGTLFYLRQMTTYRKIVDTWSCVGIQLGVCKDIRIKIGRLIWKERKYVEAPKEESLISSVTKTIGAWFSK